MDFLDILFDRKDLVEKALEVDEKVMKENLTSDDFYSDIEKLLLLEPNTYKELKNQNNTLIIYDGKPIQTIRILSSLNPEGNFILFPNHSYLGINSLICKAYNMKYNDKIKLDNSLNYNRYIAAKDIFTNIYVISEKEEYLEIKNDFNEAKYIEINNN